MGQTMRFQETLRRLTMIEEGFVGDEARLGLGPVVSAAPGIATALEYGIAAALGEPD